MLQPAMPPAPLHSLLFQLSDIELKIQSADIGSPLQYAGQHTLLLFTSGSGNLYIDEEPLELYTDKCILLSPGESFRTVGSEITLYYYHITFTAIRNSSDKEPESYTGQILPGRRALIAYPTSKLLRLAEELLENRNYPDDISGFKQHFRFQELLLFLFEHNLRSEHICSPAQSVEGTIHYLQEHYMENITVKQLAQLANVSFWQYTPIFQKLTGRKPLDFLTELRINHSKHLLHSGEPLREIARQVGYSDEYYFNRRFRQRTGVAPGQYALTHRKTRRVRDWTGHEVDIPDRPKRIIYHGETIGDLLALGVKPIGGEDSFSWNRVYKHRLKKLANVGFPIDPGRTDALSPDLIIMATADGKQYGRIAPIAPTLTFNSFAPLDERLQQLGSWLGKEREAAAWLDTFNVKNAAIWQRLYTDILRPGETASVLIYDHGNRLFAMGASGLAPALYAPGGFTPVDKIKDILDQEMGYAEVEMEQLHEYAGDRIFMLIPEREDSRAAMEQLMLSPHWNSLPAVQNRFVYLLDGAKWNSGDALTREKLLTLLPKLLEEPTAMTRSCLLP